MISNDRECVMVLGIHARNAMPPIVHVGIRIEPSECRNSDLGITNRKPREQCCNYLVPYVVSPMSTELLRDNTYVVTDIVDARFQ